MARPKSGSTAHEKICVRFTPEMTAFIDSKVEPFKSRSDVLRKLVWEAQQKEAASV